MLWAMGAIWTRIWGKPSTKALLEKISTQVASIEKFKHDTQAWHKKVIGYLLLYFASLYFLAAVVVYFKYYHDPRWQDVKSQLKLFLPFLIAPLILYIVKRCLTWWYHRKLRRNEEKLERLRAEKSKILEEVMENETYKVAKEILDKYGGGVGIGGNSGEFLLQKPKSLATPSSSKAANASSSSSSSELRRRHSAAVTTGNKDQAGTAPASSGPAAAAAGPSGGAAANGSGGGGGPLALRQTQSFRATPQGPHMQTSLPPQGSAAAFGGRGDIGGSPALRGSPAMQRAAGGHHRPGGPPGPPMPRPILPRERGYMDKVVEYLVGDGPANRYALICKQCQSHNGMALREEFEFISFRCCYCFYWNPARKQRPTAPKLPSVVAGPMQPGAIRPSATGAGTIRESSGTDTTDDESDNNRQAAAVKAIKPALPRAVAADKPKTLGLTTPAAAVGSGGSINSCRPPPAVAAAAEKVREGASDKEDTAAAAVTTDDEATAATAEKVREGGASDKEDTAAAAVTTDDEATTATAAVQDDSNEGGASSSQEKEANLDQHDEEEAKGKEEGPDVTHDEELKKED